MCQLRDGLLYIKEYLEQMEIKRQEEHAQMEAKLARMQEQLSQLMNFMEQKFSGSKLGGPPFHPQLEDFINFIIFYLLSLYVLLS